MWVPCYEQHSYGKPYPGLLHYHEIKRNHADTPTRKQALSFRRREVATEEHKASTGEAAPET
jgi:hypothetical protein